jgi:methanogenic corrinoid protein MtbC1
MEKLLTTKDLAAAIGASESSMRRWTDSGAIRTSRTVGGHRRITLSEAIRFIRETRATLVRPDVLGLGAVVTSAGADDQDESHTTDLFNALNDGDAARCRGLVLGMYLGGRSLAGIFDGPLGRAIQRVGELWQHGPAGILVEHRASDICLQVVSELRRLIPPLPEGEAPVAIGGAPQGDPYVLPSMMVAAVLAGEGYREVNFGPHTPVELLADAAESRGAKLVWLSVSVSIDPAAAGLRREIEALTARLRERDAHLVLGGRHVAAHAPQRAAPNVHVLQTLAELTAFARGVRPAPTTAAAAPADLPKT